MLGVNMVKDGDEPLNAVARLVWWILVDTLAHDDNPDHRQVWEGECSAYAEMCVTCSQFGPDQRATAKQTTSVDQLLGVYMCASRIYSSIVGAEPNLRVCSGTILVVSAWVQTNQNPATTSEPDSAAQAGLGCHAARRFSHCR